MNSTTSQTSSKNTITQKQLADRHKYPYILIDIQLQNGKKNPRAVQNGWLKWDYDRCQKHNNQPGVKDRCKYMLINLKKSGLMVVDVDGGDTEALLKEYGNMNYTKSVNRQMPHIYFNRTPDDPYNTQINVKNNNVDYLYSHVFEHVDSAVHNYDPDGFDDFDWEHYLGQKIESQPNNALSPCAGLQTADVSCGHPLLDIIHIKYWTQYASWRNLVWACIDEFGETNGTEIAIKYSKLISGVYEDGCVEKVAQYFKKGLVSWGTVHHFARESNPDAYALLMSPDIKPDDETLAQLFLFAFGENITKDKFGNDYIFFRDAWKKSNKETANLMKQLISTETQKIMNASLKQNMKKMHELASDSPEYAKLEKMCHDINDSIKRVRMTNPISAIYSKVKNILSVRLETEIIFDVGDDQLYNIQFKNGVYELDKKCFRPRTKEDYVTKTLSWNYEEERNQENMNIVNTFFQQVQPDPEMNRFLKEWLAYCLCGDTSHEVFKVNVGNGSNGKTAEFMIHMICFPLYCMKVNNKTFTYEYESNRHKEMRRQIDEPIRFTAVEEMVMKRADEDYTKEYVSGSSISLRVMYGDSVEIRSQAKLNTCSQHEPNMRGDGGILRRGLLQRYNSTFVDKECDVNESSHIYIKDKGFHKKFNDDNMKLAYFHVLMDNYTDLDIPDSLRNNFKESLAVGDNFKNKFDDCYEIVDYESRISKADIIEKWGDTVNNKGLKWGELMSEMNRIGCKYSSKLRGPNGKQGCFINIAPVVEEEDVEDD